MKSLTGALVSLVVGAALGVVAVVGITTAANPDKTATASSDTTVNAPGTTGGTQDSGSYDNVLDYGSHG
ncbi:MAG: hypothetical protein ACXVX8_08660 [Blastococcus sp.]